MQIFLDAFGSIPDPRASNARHDLGELLVIAFVSVLCGSSSCAEMAEFGAQKRTFSGTSSSSSTPYPHMTRFPMCSR